jgi:hypothetical protein
MEGPFADSILESDFFSRESSRLRDSLSKMDGPFTEVVQRSLEILENLKDRMRENGNNPRMNPFRLPVLDNVCSDFF